MDKRIRVHFDLERADNPRLYDELARFAKGPKRTNRLRMLAYDGLLAQSGSAAMTAAAVPSPPEPESLGLASQELFGPSL